VVHESLGLDEQCVQIRQIRPQEGSGRGLGHSIREALWRVLPNGELTCAAKELRPPFPGQIVEDFEPGVVPGASVILAGIAESDNEPGHGRRPRGIREGETV
jgi:hypothetical protein